MKQLSQHQRDLVHVIEEPILGLRSADTLVINNGGGSDDNRVFEEYHGGADVVSIPIERSLVPYEDDN